MELVLKLVYSVALMCVAGLAAREFWTVWFDKRVYIGRFDVVSEAGEDEDEGAKFPRRVVAAQTLFAQQLAEYSSRSTGDSQSDTTFEFSDAMRTLALPSDVLSDVGITVQQINLPQLLGAVRSSFLAPNEVRGFVTTTDGATVASVSWPRAPVVGTDKLSQFLVPSRPNKQEAAAYLACVITWARIAEGGRNEHLKGMSREQFCDFVFGLTSLYALDGPATGPGGLDDGQKTCVRRRVAALQSHYNEDYVLPDVFRLRADLLDLLPEPHDEHDLRDAEDDRLRYAAGKADLHDISSDDRMKYMALARPALFLKHGVVASPPDNWKDMLDRHSSEIARIAAATGAILRDGVPVGTGVIVAPGMVMTMPANLDPREPPSARLELCMGDRVQPCEHRFTIGDILYRDDTPRNEIALASFDDSSSPAGIRPAPLARGLPHPDAIVGTFAYVVGYPLDDPSSRFAQRLLEGVPGAQRVLPGRVLRCEGNKLTTDVSTTKGTAGAPLVDFATGRIVGISRGTQWSGERGKFARSTTIPDEVIRLVDEKQSWRKRGDEESVDAAPVAAPAPEPTLGVGQPVVQPR